jgi:hypothetical protein
MALSVVDLYTKILPRTNCKDCGYLTCLAFAGMVVSEKLPLKNCPHIDPALINPAQAELEEQYRQGKWLKKDMAAEALTLAKEKAASMDLADIAARIGGQWQPPGSQGPFDQAPHIILPYFNTHVYISREKILDARGQDTLTRNEQTFIFIHMAHGGDATPTGQMKSFKEFPNTVSKIVSMKDQVEIPLSRWFARGLDRLDRACRSLGGTDVGQRYDSPDRACQFRVFPKVFVTLLFWDAEEGFEADAKLLFDETVTDHLDIEAIMFLSEHLAKQLMAADT